MDHERVNIRPTSMSCGVMELSRINDDTEGVLYNLASRLYHPSRGEPCAFFVFSDVSEGETSSLKLVEAVYKYGFGNTSSGPARENTKTGNVIAVYVWGIDHEKFKAWYAEERVKKMGKVGT